MNDILTDPKALIGWLCTAIMGLVMYIWRKSESETKERLAFLEKNAATKEEVNQRHKENLERLDRIEEAATGTHRRIDDLYRDLLGKD